jgi:transposase
LRDQSRSRSRYAGCQRARVNLADTSDARLPANARANPSVLVARITSWRAEIGAIEKSLLKQDPGNADSKRLETILNISVLGAGAIVARFAELRFSRLGVTSRLGSASFPAKISNGKRRLGPISKQGDRYLRGFLVYRKARTHPEKYPWIARPLARKPAKVVAVTIANKTAVPTMQKTTVRTP